MTIYYVWEVEQEHSEIDTYDAVSESDAAEQYGDTYLAIDKTLNEYNDAIVRVSTIDPRKSKMVPFREFVVITRLEPYSEAQELS